MVQSKNPRESTLVLRLQPDTVLPDPVGANFVTMAQVGMSVSLLVGWFDLHKTARRLNNVDPSPESPIDLNVTHQFLISLETFQQLHRQVNEIAEKMQPAAGGKK